VADIGVGAYGLKSLSGPVELVRGDGAYALKARLAGFGGQGDGLAAALLGGAPTANLDVRRLANGQLVVRSLDLAGRGLKAEAK